MELLIRNLPLFIVFQVATTNYVNPIQMLNFQSFLRSPRYAKASSSAPNGFGISGNDQFLSSFPLTGNQYTQFPLFPSEGPQYGIQNQQQQFSGLHKDISQYKSNKKMQKQSEDDTEYLQPLEVVDGYLRPPKQNSKPGDKFKVLDNIIKDRVAALQRFQDDFNKLLEDITNTALSFVSKHSFFGGAMRKSILDPSNLDSLKVINSDVLKVGSDLYKIYSNVLYDIDAGLHFLADHRNYSLKDLFAHGVTAMLRIFTFP